MFIKLIFTIFALTFIVLSIIVLYTDQLLPIFGNDNIDEPLNDTSVSINTDIEGDDSTTNEIINSTQYNSSKDLPHNAKEDLRPVGTNSLRWKVLLPYGKPATGAIVTIIKINDNIRNDFFQSDDHLNYPFELNTTTTNTDGSFSFNNIVPNLYLVHAELNGFGPAYCELNNINNNRITNLEILRLL